jgi:hypothetical protein
MHRNGEHEYASAYEYADAYEDAYNMKRNVTLTMHMKRKMICKYI